MKAYFSCCGGVEGMDAKRYLFSRVVMEIWKQGEANDIISLLEDSEPMYVTEDRLVLYIPEEETRLAFSRKYEEKFNQLLSDGFSKGMAVELWDEKQKGEYEKQCQNLGPYPADQTFGRFLKKPENLATWEGAYGFTKPEQESTLLCIQGPKFTGKTHLSYAMAHRMYQQNPKSSILVMRMDDLIQELIMSFRVKPGQIPQSILDADFLVVEDVHFYGERTETMRVLRDVIQARQRTGKKTCITTAYPLGTVSVALEELVKSGGETVVIGERETPAK